jgi:Spy/CpxP family protein refolding chaperone
VAWAAQAWAQPGPGGAQPKPGEGPGYPMYFGVPGFYMLGMENVQKQLELLPEQKEKLREIAKKYQEDSRQVYQGHDWTKFRELPQEEQRAKYREMQERYTKLGDEAKKAAEAVLLPHQINKIKQLELRQRISGMLYNPGTLDQIGFTAEQKEKLKALREEQQKKMAELQEEMMDKTMGLLTPEQQKQLEELSSKPFQPRVLGGERKPGGQ